MYVLKIEKKNAQERKWPKGNYAEKWILRLNLIYFSLFLALCGLILFLLWGKDERNGENIEESPSATRVLPYVYGKSKMGKITLNRTTSGGFMCIHQTNKWHWIVVA